MGTKVKIIPVKAHNSVGIIERYYGLIRRAYLIIMAEINEINKNTALQIAFKAINNSARPDSIILTLLVYGALPQITKYNALLLTML
jgi:hypothetical protein